jgi:hypothetical protein
MLGQTKEKSTSINSEGIMNKKLFALFLGSGLLLSQSVTAMPSQWLKNGKIEGVVKEETQFIFNCPSGENLKVEYKSGDAMLKVIAPNGVKLTELVKPQKWIGQIPGSNMGNNPCTIVVTPKGKTLDITVAISNPSFNAVRLRFPKGSVNQSTASLTQKVYLTVNKPRLFVVWPSDNRKHLKINADGANIKVKDVETGHILSQGVSIEREISGDKPYVVELLSSQTLNVSLKVTVKN